MLALTNSVLFLENASGYLLFLTSRVLLVGNLPNSGVQLWGHLAFIQTGLLKPGLSIKVKTYFSLSLSFFTSYPTPDLDVVRFLYFIRIFERC